MRSVPQPGRRGKAVEFFGDCQRACRHLRDHLLAAPPCEAWALVDARYSAPHERDVAVQPAETRGRVDSPHAMWTRRLTYER